MRAALHISLTAMPLVRAASYGYLTKFNRDGGHGDDDDDSDGDDDNDHGHHHSSGSSFSSTSSASSTATSSPSTTSSSTLGTSPTSSSSSSSTSDLSATSPTQHSHTLTTATASPSTNSTGLSQSSPTAQAANNQRGLGGGAVGGVVVAILVFLVIIFNIFLYIRRRMRNKRLELQSANLAAFDDKRGPTQPSTALLVDHPTSLRPASASAVDSFSSVPTAPLLGAFYDSEQRGLGHGHTDSLTVPSTNLSRTSSGTSMLPNPYDTYDVIAAYAAPPPTSPPTSQPASSPPSSFRPVSTQSTVSANGLAYLQRDNSRHTVSSADTSTGRSLHDEMTVYQKRLEAQGSSVPADPPPGYRESVSGPSAS